MSNFIRRQQTGWSDFSDDLLQSDDSTETTFCFQLGNKVAKAKSITKNSLQLKQGCSVARIDTTEKNTNRGHVQSAYNANFDFTVPTVPASRTSTLPFARDCLNPSDSDSSVDIHTRTTHTLEPIQRLNVLPNNMIHQQMKNSNLGSNREGSVHSEISNASESLRREVYRRQMAGPIATNKISLEEVSYRDLTKLIKTISPKKKKFLLQALDNSPKMSISDNDRSRRPMQRDRNVMSSTVRNGYSPSSSDISSSDERSIYSNRSRKSIFKRRSKKKSFRCNDVYYNKSLTQFDDNNFHSMSTIRSYPVMNNTNNTHLAGAGTLEFPDRGYRYTMQPSTLNTTQFPRHQLKEYDRGYSLASEYSNTSTQPSLSKRKLFSQSQLCGETSAVNYSNSPMRQVTVHNVYGAEDNAEPRKRKRSTLFRRSIAHKNTTQSIQNMSSNLMSGGISPLLRKLVSQDLISVPVATDQSWKKDLHKDNNVPSYKSNENFAAQQSTPAILNCSKRRKFLTSCSEPETDKENLPKDKSNTSEQTKSSPKRNQKISKIKLRQCHVVIERIPSDVVQYVLSIMASKESAKPTKHNNNENVFKVPMKPLPTNKRKKNAGSTQPENNYLHNEQAGNSEDTLSSEKIDENKEISKEVKKNLKNPLSAKSLVKKPANSKKILTTPIKNKDRKNCIEDERSREIDMSNNIKSVEDTIFQKKKKQLEKTTTKAKSQAKNTKPLKESKTKIKQTKLPGEHSATPPKRKYFKRKEKPPAEVINETGVRRSERIRVRPLKYWNNESAIYRQERLYDWQDNFSNSTKTYPRNSSESDKNHNSNEENILYQSSRAKSKISCSNKNKVKKGNKSEMPSTEATLAWKSSLEQVTEPTDNIRNVATKLAKDNVKQMKKSTNKPNINEPGIKILSDSHHNTDLQNDPPLTNKVINSKTKDNIKNVATKLAKDNVKQMKKSTNTPKINEPGNRILSDSDHNTDLLNNPPLTNEVINSKTKDNIKNVATKLAKDNVKQMKKSTNTPKINEPGNRILSDSDHNTDLLNNPLLTNEVINSKTKDNIKNVATKLAKDNVKQMEKSTNTPKINEPGSRILSDSDHNTDLLNDPPLTNEVINSKTKDNIKNVATKLAKDNVKQMEKSTNTPKINEPGNRILSDSHVNTDLQNALTNEVINSKTKDNIIHKKLTNSAVEHVNIIINHSKDQTRSALSDDEECMSIISYRSSKASKRTRFMHFF